MDGKVREDMSSSPPPPPLAPSGMDGVITAFYIIMSIMGAGVLAGLLYCCFAIGPKSKEPKLRQVSVSASIVAPMPFLALEKC